MVTEKIKPVSITYKVERMKFEEIYLYFCKNKYTKYEDFFSGLEKIYNKSVDVTILKNYFDFVKITFSPTKAHEMSLILDYVLAKELHDTMMEKQLKEEVDKITYRNSGIPNKFILNSYESKKRNDPNDERINTINEDMQMVIDEKKSIKELEKEDKIKNKALLTKIKKDLKHLDKDKFIEFVVFENDLQPTSINEIDQYIEVVEYFIKHIKEKIDILSNINYSMNEDIIKIYNIHISGEDDLNDTYIENERKLCSWKISKLQILLDKYNIVLDTLIEMKDFKDIKSLSIFSTKLFSMISKENDFVFDYIKDLLKIYRTYERHIKSINTVGDSSKEEIKEKFVNRLVLENNN